MDFERSRPAPSVIHLLRPAAGGMAVHVRRLVQGLSGIGVKCRLAADSATLAAVDVPSVPQVLLQPFPTGALLLAAPRLLVEASRAADIIHAHGLRAAPLALRCARHAGIHTVLTLHNLPSGKSRAELLFARSLARRCGRVIAVSDAIALALHSTRTVDVIVNGVPIPELDQLPKLRGAARRRLGVEMETPLLMAAGRLAPEKGFDLLLLAWPEVKSRVPNAELRVLGGGPEQSRLELIAHRIGLDPHSILAGPVPDAARLLAGADVVVAPSRSEGQGLAILEAMASRVAVIASRTGGLVASIQQPQAGLLTEPGSIPDLSESLVRLLTDPEMRRRMACNGRRAAVARYSLNRMIQETAAIYSQVRSTSVRQ